MKNIVSDELNEMMDNFEFLSDSDKERMADYCIQWASLAALHQERYNRTMC